jgi:hypothetical protein
VHRKANSRVPHVYRKRDTSRVLNGAAALWRGPARMVHAARTSLPQRLFREAWQHARVEVKNMAVRVLPRFSPKRYAVCRDRDSLSVWHLHHQK